MWQQLQEDVKERREIVRFTVQAKIRNCARLQSTTSKANRFIFPISQMHKNLFLTMINYLLVNISFLCLCLRSFSFAQSSCVYANALVACACVTTENQALNSLLSNVKYARFLTFSGWLYTVILHREWGKTELPYKIHYLLARIARSSFH